MGNEQKFETSVQSAPTAPGKGVAVAAMVLGIVSVVSAPLAPLLTPISVGTGVIGLILGLVVLKGTRRRPATHGGRGQAIAGVVLSAITLLGTVLVLTLFISVGDRLA